MMTGNEDGYGGTRVERETGAWIFVSHSFKDSEKVRALRNELEAQGHYPLLFFLKCLNDDSELDDLIRREIEAREWFLLCDSQNARASHKVQQEIDIIKRLPSRAFETVDLDAEFAVQLERANLLTRRATIYISHANSDGEATKTIAAEFRAHDYGVTLATEAPSGVPWAQWIVDSIERAADRGFVMVVLSKSANASAHVLSEIEAAMSRRASIIVAVLPGFDMASLSSGIRFYLERAAIFYFAEDRSLSENARALIAFVKEQRPVSF